MKGLRVCVIGGGGTGAALAYDLALRGLAVVLLEKGELTSGTTGRHHGQLHCGARYALADPGIARECMEESRILRRIAPEAIEFNGGIFVALDDSDELLVPEFADACGSAGIPARPLAIGEALDLEPALNPAIRGAVRVPDGSFDAYRVPLSFFAAARALGAEIRPWSEVIGLERSGGRVVAMTYLDRGRDPPREVRLEADFFVNAAGAWAGKVGALAGIDVPVTPAPGTMVAVRGRLTDHVVSHLHPAGNGDIVVPQRALSIIGSTEHVVDDPESLLPPAADVQFLRDSAAAMIPAFRDAPIHAVWCAARPLAGFADGNHRDGAAARASRTISRDFLVVDHEKTSGTAGMCTIIGGKATVLRAMAEKAADLACHRLGIEVPSRTRDYVLPSWRSYLRE